MIYSILHYGPIIVFLSVLAYNYKFGIEWFPKTIKGIILVSVLWVFIVQFDSFILGPYGRLEMGDGEMMYLGYFPYLTRMKDSLFLPDLIGGVDRYGLGRIGGAIISGRLLMVEIMPLWLVLIILRFFVTGVAFASVYIFSHKRLNAEPIVAFAFAALFSSSFDVTTSLTFLYGLSIAGMPLLLYFLVSLNKDLKGWFYFITYALVYVSFSEPIYWLPGLWATAICLLFWHRPNSYIFFFGSLIALSAVWTLNYSESIYAMVLLSPYSTRDLVVHHDFQKLLISNFSFMFDPTIRYNAGGLPFILPFLITLWAAIRTRSIQCFIAFITVLALAMAHPFLKIFPWEYVHLDFLISYNWYLEYCAFPYVMLTATAATISLINTESISNHNQKHLITRPITVFSLCLSVSIAMLFFWKANTVLHMTTRGNMTKLESIPNLVNADWYQAKENLRVIGVPTIYSSNASVSYGLPGFDGRATIIPKSTFLYWSKLILKRDSNIHPSYPGLAVRSDYINCCSPYAIEQDVDLDMLRVANVGYILSYRILTSENLRQVSGPVVQKPRSFPSSLIDHAPELFVYALNNPFARIYLAKSVKIVPTDASEEEYVRLTQSLAPKGIAVIHQQKLHAKTLVDSMTIKADDAYNQFVKYKIVKNGFDIELNQNHSQIILVNAPPLPWWEAESDHGVLNIVPANIGQMAILTTPETRFIKLRYRRPTLFSQIFR